MVNTVKTFETKNNIYQLGYRVTAKTSYEQQQEYKEHMQLMVFQKSLGTLIIVLGFVIPAIFNRYDDIGIVTPVMLFLGLILILANKKAFVI